MGSINLCVSAKNCGRPQGATVLEDTCNLLLNLSAVSDELYMYAIITKLINNY